MTSGKFRRDEKNRAEALRWCAFFGREMTLFCKATLLGVCTFDIKWMKLLGRDTTSENSPV